MGIPVGKLQLYTGKKLFICKFLYKKQNNFFVFIKEKYIFNKVIHRNYLMRFLVSILTILLHIIDEF